MFPAKMSFRYFAGNGLLNQSLFPANIDLFIFAGNVRMTD
jgi:hypothetical protein